MTPLRYATLLAAIALAVESHADDPTPFETTLHTGHPISVAEVGTAAESRSHFTVQNRSAAAVTIRLRVLIEDDRMRRRTWMSQPVEIAAKSKVDVPLSEALGEVGWYRVTPTVVVDDEEITGTTRSIAVIEPLESRMLPPEEGFWFGFDSRVRTPAMLRLLSRMGVDILRFGTWAGVQKDETTFDWTNFDTVADGMRKNGMQPLYSVTFTPPFAVKPEYRGKGDPSRLPPRPEALEKSLRTIVGHTKEKGVTIYDLWNEPDHRGFWRGNTDDYLEFVRVATKTIKDVQPDATVLSGGIASLHQGPTDGLNPQLDRRLIVDGQDTYDVLALHEHGTFERFDAALAGPLAEHRRGLDREVPLWFTETGHDGDPLVKARVLVQKFVHARSHGARGLVWYAMYAPGQGGKYNVIDAKGDPQPAIPAYAHLVRRLRGTRFGRRVEDATGAGNRLYLFEGEGRTILVAWGSGATTHQSVVRPANGAVANGFDLMGRPLELERSDGAVRLPFSETPSYLEVAGRVEIDEPEPVPAIALFSFGTPKPSGNRDGVRVSDLEAPGWQRPNFDDRDQRMARSTSGPPNGSFDGTGDQLRLRFTVTPDEGSTIDFDSIGFWGNSGAFNGTRLTVSRRVGEGDPVVVGTTALANLSAPRVNGAYYTFPLDGLTAVDEPVTFSLEASRGGERVILKIDDLRVDGRPGR